MCSAGVFEVEPHPAMVVDDEVEDEEEDGPICGRRVVTHPGGANRLLGPTDGRNDPRSYFDASLLCDTPFLASDGNSTP